MSPRNIRQVVNYNVEPGVSYPALITSLAEDGTANGLAVFHEGGVEVKQGVPRGGACGDSPVPGTWTWAETWSEAAPAPMRSTRASTDKELYLDNEAQRRATSAEIRRLSKREGELLASLADARGRIDVMEQNQRTCAGERLANALCSLLAKHAGERGDNEGAVETLERVLKERAAAKAELAAATDRADDARARPARTEVSASGVMTPQSLDGLQGLVEKTMAEHGSETRMCLKASELLGLLKTRFVRGTPSMESGPMLLQSAERVGELQRQLVDARAAKDTAYRERNTVLALLARAALALGWRVGTGEHPAEDDSWEPDWRALLFIDTPEGQCSWHFHDSERHLLSGLPRYTDAWDGHTTEEKHQRVEAAMRAVERDELRATPKTNETLKTVSLRAVREAVDSVALASVRYAEERRKAADVCPDEARQPYLLQAEHGSGVADGAARVLSLLEDGPGQSPREAAPEATGDTKPSTSPKE